jgi:hypothetical protein
LTDTPLDEEHLHAGAGCERDGVGDVLPPELEPLP